MSPDDPKTEELKAVQVEREQAEREMADAAPDEDEELTHERRAERASYLADKLREQAEADEE